jgi:hypothetical protein
MRIVGRRICWSCLIVSSNYLGVFVKCVSVKCCKITVCAQVQCSWMYIELLMSIELSKMLLVIGINWKRGSGFNCIHCKLCTKSGTFVVWSTTIHTWNTSITFHSANIQVANIQIYNLEQSFKKNKIRTNIFFGEFFNFTVCDN